MNASARHFAWVVVACFALLGGLYAEAQSVPGSPVQTASGAYVGAADSGSGTNQEIAYWVGAKLGGSSLLKYDTAGIVKAIGSNSSTLLTGNNDATSHAELYPTLGVDVNDTANGGYIAGIVHGSFAPTLVLARSRGSHATPTAVSTNDVLGGIAAYGWTGATFSVAANLNARASENYSLGHVGSYWQLLTFKNANGGSNVWKFDQDGSTTSPQGFRNFSDGAGTIYTTADGLATNDRSIILSDSLSGKAWLEASTNSGGYLVCGAPDSARLTGLGQTLPNVHDGFCSAFGGDYYLLAASGSPNGVRLKADGGWGYIEQAAPTGVSGYATSYADSTSHAAKLSNAGDAFDDYARKTSAWMTSSTTNATATFSTVLGVALQIGNYQCHGELILSDSTSADGAQCEILMTSGSLAAGSAGSVQLVSTTANTGDAGVASGAFMVPSVSLTVFPSGVCVADASVLVTGAGTLGFATAQAAHTTGTLTNAGGSLQCARL